MRFKFKLPSFLIVLVLLDVGCATTATGPRQLAWDTLPFPENSNWTGPKGSPAQIKDGDLVLQGQMVRTHETYSTPLVVECEVELENRTAPDGYVGVEFVPAGAPRDLAPTRFRSFRIIYRNPGAYSGKDGLAVFGRDDSAGDKMLWGEAAFYVDAKKSYTIRLEIAADHVHGLINGKSYDFQGVTIPYKQFYIQLEGWQPTNRWHVRKFSVQ
jgi:hypothetical protein